MFFAALESAFASDPQFTHRKSVRVGRFSSAGKPHSAHRFDVYSDPTCFSVIPSAWAWAWALYATCSYSTVQYSTGFRTPTCAPRMHLYGHGHGYGSSPRTQSRRSRIGLDCFASSTIESHSTLGGGRNGAPDHSTVQSVGGHFESRSAGGRRELSHTPGGSALTPAH